MKRESEKRSYFRINDVIGLSYTTYDSTDEFTAESSGELELPLLKLLDEIDIKFNQVSNTVWHESPAIAQALGLLNRKVSLLASRGLRENEQIVDVHPEMTVNMSGCGMGFHCNEALPVDSSLRVSVVLKPSNVRLKFTARVVGCESRSGDTKNPYWMRIRIDEENTVAQEQLIQHIVQKQCAQIDRERVVDE